MTARAINILLDEGLVTACGRGTFVKPLVLSTATFGFQAFESLSSTATIPQSAFCPSGPRPLLHASTSTLASPSVRSHSIRRLLSVATPVAYHREYLVFDPEQPVVEAEMGITSLQGLFEGRGETTLQAR